MEFFVSLTFRLFSFCEFDDRRGELGAEKKIFQFFR